MRYWHRITDADAQLFASLGAAMGRAERPLAACAIVLGLLAGASCAVAAADGDDVE
jgi:hypothetical protein